MTVTITIGRASVIADLRVKCHELSATIVDPEERYIVESGTEKLPEVHQCVTDAFAEATSVVRPFLSGTVSSSANDAYTSTGDLSLALDVTQRKASGLAAPLANAIHKYVVDTALVRYFRSVGRPAFAESYAQTLATDLTAINSIIYRRTKPSY